MSVLSAEELGERRNPVGQLGEVKHERFEQRDTGQDHQASLDQTIGVDDVGVSLVERK